jgi:hypothetical protein
MRDTITSDLVITYNTERRLVRTSTTAAFWDFVLFWLVLSRNIGGLQRGIRAGIPEPRASGIVCLRKLVGTWSPVVLEIVYQILEFA